MVSAAGVAPAIPRSQAEYVAATLRALCPGGFAPSEAGERETLNLGKRSRGKKSLNGGDRRVTLPHQLGCRASALLVCHDPIEIGKLPRCCPRQAEFWKLCRTSWCTTFKREIWSKNLESV